MASGINNTFRQVGIATGVAALGAVFQSQVSSKLAELAPKAPPSFADAVSSGATPVGCAAGARQPAGPAHDRRQPGLHQRLQRDPADRRGSLPSSAAVAGFALVRSSDFVVAPDGEAPPPSPRPPERPPRPGRIRPGPLLEAAGMLLELRIENLLLIERAELRFADGLNAITGETGAGKTVLAHSLDLLMGGKARPQIVRPGAEEAYVEGVFALPPELFADEELAELAERMPEGADEIVLGRRIGASGRTSAFVQGRSASAADLRALGSRLLGFYGQHEHRKLVLSSAQLEILDGFAGAEHLDRRARYREAHMEVGSISRELAELRDREGARERDLDLLRFELAEIEAAAPNPDEEDELTAERDRLRHAERLRTAAATALAAIAGVEDDGGARGALGGAESELASVEGIDPELDSVAEQVRAVSVELDDAASALAVLRSTGSRPSRSGSSSSRSD